MKMHHWLFRKIRRAILPLVVVAVPFSAIYADRHERLIDTWQPLHFEIALALNDSLSEIVSATADVRILVRKKDLRMVDFDFGQLRVSSVRIEGETARFVQRDDKLNVYLPHEVPQWATVSISIGYSGKPSDGLTMVKDKDGRPSAIGDNWPDRVHNWIPCLDHPSAKASVSFTVTAPSRDSVVANGILESKNQN